MENRSSLLILSFFIIITLCFLACKNLLPFSLNSTENKTVLKDTSISYLNYLPEPNDIVISRAKYLDKMHGFWLGQCIANWTGLVTEMDKIGNIGEIKTGDFYTRDNWGKADQASIWGEGKPSDLSATINFIFEDKDGMWGADDDTDIEYIYQHLLYENKTSFLSPIQIRDGWLKHIKTEEENYVWVSNQAAFDLMHKGILPPETSSPVLNPHFDMIDAQLTTEIFGLLAPGRPNIALEMAYLPIRTTAGNEAASIAEFYVIMHSLASLSGQHNSIKDKIFNMAKEARKHLPDTQYPAKMYDFVERLYKSGVRWEEARDSLYKRYQLLEEDGYDITSRELYCNGCFAAGINYGASLISLFYGEGNLLETIKIGTLAGWDSDNPTATWGGLLGFMMGKQGIESAFGRSFSEKFNIHRTRINFDENGIDTFSKMAEKAVYIIDRCVQEEMNGGIDLEKNQWYIPQPNSQIPIQDNIN